MAKQELNGAGCLALLIIMPIIFTIAFGFHCLLAHPVIWAAQGLFDVAWTTDWYYIWRVAACTQILMFTFGASRSAKS